MASTSRGGILNTIERIGNALPDPATLFLLATVLIFALSWVGTKMNWSVAETLPHPVMETVVDGDGQSVERQVIDPKTNQPLVEWEETGVVLRTKNLLSSEGIFHALKTLVTNFITFPPLGIVLVGMLGVGVAERTGLISAALKAFMLVTPGWLLTPAVVFIGVNSSIASDAGYVVLPPLAAALYLSVGRSPLAGIAAVFAGVSGGFSANLLITGADPLLASLTERGAQVIDPAYVVNPFCNWYFMIASTVMLTFVGWAVTAWFVERRLKTRSPEEGGPVKPSDDDLANQRFMPGELNALAISGVAFVLSIGVFVAMALIKGGPLHGVDEKQAVRWVQPIVPMLFFCFVIPGIVFGLAMKTIRNDKDIAKLMIQSIAAMAPMIVLAFFAAQFIELFKYSNLDKMLALTGGLALGKAGFSPSVLLTAFIIVTLIFNLFIGSASAKWAMFAPIFVPMFMMIGISPELTQVTYRIGDSVTNIITPLNAYLLIILVVMQKYAPRGGIGTLIALMTPYSIVFTIVWTLFLLMWVGAGIPLGIDGHLTYPPPVAVP